MSTMRACPCLNSRVAFPTAGRSAHQANRDLRKALIFDLCNGTDRPAFVSSHPENDIPRADDLEKLMFSFPGLQEINYNSPPALPISNMDVNLWQRLHATHCTHVPACSQDHIRDDCYFKPLHFMLKYGFQAHLAPGKSLDDIRPHSPAYIHLWKQDEDRCDKAFQKLLKSTQLTQIPKPKLLFPLLPAYRGKHLWKFRKFGIDYLPRLASDISSSGGNSVFSDWRLRYLALHAICAIISRGDYLATRDITGFFNRLAAGETLRKLQCFQDPRSYASTAQENNINVLKGEATFLQQQTCMFGHKQIPAWASCVSSELARILHHNYIRVAGVLIDDFLFHGPKEDGPEALQKQLDETDKIMTELGVPPNDKGTNPTQRLTFSGICIDTVSGLLDIDDEQRQYVIHRLEDLIPQQSCLTKDLASVNGSLGWLCFVIHHGRCRRDLLQEAVNTDDKKTDISAPLRKQMRWWLHTLKTKSYYPSPIWFHDEEQKTVLIQSDASGQTGFGFCAAGLHVTGCWQRSLEPFITGDMYVCESLPITIAVLLLADVLPEHIFGGAIDNSGVVFRINCGSCRNPLGRRLLTAMMDALAKNKSHILADWNNREQIAARHADDLSKVFSTEQWDIIRPEDEQPWKFDLIIQDIESEECIACTIRIPRLAEALPIHQRH